jgi:hypothetical protein
MLPAMAGEGGRPRRRRQEEETRMNVDAFRTLIQPVIEAIAGKPVGAALAAELNDRFPADGPVVKAIEKACHEAIAAGWMCSQGGEGRRFGRVIEAGPETRDLSVDVVDLKDIVGPHHSHPNGEICLTLPITPGARFDGHADGWCVYPPGSAHHPTVTGGEALVLYLLPGGKIQFTGQT